jgi:hypothetical protein
VIGTGTFPLPPIFSDLCPQLCPVCTLFRGLTLPVRSLKLVGQSPPSAPVNVRPVQPMVSPIDGLLDARRVGEGVIRTGWRPA